MSIIVILSGALFAAHGSAEKKMALSRTALTLVQDIREVQEMAMAAREIDCGAETTFSIGVNFDANSYRLFADCVLDNQYNPSNDIVLREIALENNVEFSVLAPSSPLDIVFTPPDPIVFINGISWEANDAEITIALKSDPAAIKVVSINPAGKIEYE